MMLRCTFCKKLKMSSLTVLCKKCKNVYCLSHRLETEHDCSRLMSKVENVELPSAVMPEKVKKI